MSDAGREANDNNCGNKGKGDEHAPMAEPDATGSGGGNELQGSELVNQNGSSPPLHDKEVQGGDVRSTSQVRKPNLQNRPLSFGEAFASMGEAPSSVHDRNKEGGERAHATLFTKPNLIIASRSQKENSMLKHIRNCPLEFGDIHADFLLGTVTCAFFLSLRFHLLHPTYIYKRIVALKGNYKSRFILVLVDVDDSASPLEDITKTAFTNQCTLILCWSEKEVARYLETLRTYENKTADLIKEKIDPDNTSRMTDCLTTVRGINKTDVLTLRSGFRSMADILCASQEELAMCPGIGEKKVTNLLDAFTEPFVPQTNPKE